MAESQQLLNAISALYGHDQSAQAQANVWLQQYATTPEAWMGALSLLDPQLLSNGSVEVVFFSSNLLLNKVKNEFGKLSQQERVQLSQATRAKLQPFLEGNIPAVLQERCSLLGTTLSVLSGHDEALAHVASACTMAAGAFNTTPPALSPLRSSLLMLQQLSEEAHGLDRTRRQAVVPALLTKCLGQVVEIVSRTVALLQQHQQVPNADQALVASAVAALRCLRSWLLMDPVGGGSTCLSPGELNARAPGLLQAAIELLASPAACASEQLCQAVSEALTEVLGTGGRSLAGDGGEGAASDALALADAGRALMTLRGAVLQPPAVFAAQAAARVASALTERRPDLMGGPAPWPLAASSAGSGGPAEFAAFVLSLVGRPERSVAEAAMDYFQALQTLPVAERHPGLGAPLFSAALPSVLQHACHPQGFTTWDEAEEDEETFYGFREEVLADVLESCYNMLRLQYVTSMTEALAGALHWQQAEAALFGLRAAALAIKAHALAAMPSAGGSSVSALGAAVVAAALHGTATPAAGSSTSSGTGTPAADLNSVLHRVFEDVCSPQAGGGRLLLAHPLAARGLARLIGDFAAWFGKIHSSPLLNALQVLLAALGSKEAQGPAAVAFRNLCVRCGDRLSDTALLTNLMQAALAVVAPLPNAGTAAGPVPVGLEERCGVVEGLARVLGGLEAEAAGEAGAMLVRPMVERAQSLAHAGGLSGPQLSILSEELQLMASTVRFLEFPGEAARGAPESHPAMRVLQAAWPVLAGVAGEGACRADAGVVTALCEVYKRSLLCAKLAARPLLPVLLTAVIDVFNSHPHAVCLEVLGTVCELYGVASSAEVRGLQEQALVAATSVMAKVQQQQQAQAEGGGAGTPSPSPPVTPLVAGSSTSVFQSSASVMPSELLAAYLTLAGRYLVFARHLLLTSPCLPHMVKWALVGLATRDRDTVAGALSLLAHLASAADKLAAGQEGGSGEDAEARARLEAVVSNTGVEWVCGLLTAGLDTCPRQLLRPLSGCFYALLSSVAFGGATAGLMRQALASPQIVGQRPDLLTPDDCARFASLALRQPLLARGRFDALIGDFCSIARGESGSDVLLAYEL